MSACGYKQTSRGLGQSVRFAPDIGQSGLLCAFSATKFKLRLHPEALPLGAFPAPW